MPAADADCIWPDSDSESLDGEIGVFLSDEWGNEGGNASNKPARRRRGADDSGDDSEIASITATMSLDIGALHASIRRQSGKCTHQSLQEPSPNCSRDLENGPANSRGERARLRSGPRKPCYSNSNGRSSRSRTTHSSNDGSFSQPPSVDEEAELMRKSFGTQLSLVSQACLQDLADQPSAGIPSLVRHSIAISSSRVRQRWLQAIADAL